MSRSRLSSTRAVMLGGATLVLLAALGGTASAAQAQPVMQVGHAAGPYKIAGGKTPVQVAHQKLNAGNWGVIVKAEIDSTATDAATHYPAKCLLQLGGAIQRTSVSPTRSGQPGSRQPITLTVAAHLAAPASARLKCNAPGSKTGVDTIRQIRFTAFRSQMLSVGPSGGQPATYGSLIAPVQVFHAWQKAPVTMAVANTWYTAAKLNLPNASAFGVTASATIVGSTNDGTVTCEITTGVDYDQVNLQVHHAGAFGDHVNVGLTVDRLSEGNWTATVICAVDPNAIGAVVRDVRITAFRVHGFQNQNVRNDDTYDPLTPGVPEVLLGGWDDGPIILSPSGNSNHIADQLLPTDRWLVVAKAWLDQTIPTGEVVSCRLGRGTSYDRITVALGDASSGDHLRPITLMWSGTLTAPGKVTLSCTSSTGGMNVLFVKMTAYRAGTLRTVSIVG